MKTLAMICVGAVITLCLAGTATAQDKHTDNSGNGDSLRELDGFWSPIPDSPRYRDTRDDLKLREAHTTQPEKSRAF